MTSMSIKTFLEVAPRLPRGTSILIRGAHGIGKSQVLKQLAERLGLPLVDRRLSQMSEGDMIGLPSTDGEVTRFNPPDYYMNACRQPVCLFYDEMNRATNEVQQAAFQIVLDRELNGWKLHPDTLVVSAVNTGASYTVNEMDPALLDRFWVIDLNPSVADWTAWARGNLPDVVVDFIKADEKWLDPPKNADLSAVHPSRRSWERLARALDGAGIIDQPASQLFYSMCLGFVGLEATNKFRDFAKERDAQFTGADIIDNYSAVRPKLKKLASQDRWNGAVEKTGDYVINNLSTLTKAQSDNLRAFAKDLPGELRAALWTSLAQPGQNKLDLVRAVHTAMSDLIIEVFSKKETEKRKK